MPSIFRAFVLLFLCSFASSWAQGAAWASASPGESRVVGPQLASYSDKAERHRIYLSGHTTLEEGQVTGVSSWHLWPPQTYRCHKSTSSSFRGVLWPQQELLFLLFMQPGHRSLPGSRAPWEGSNEPRGPNSWVLIRCPSCKPLFGPVHPMVFKGG